MIKLDKFMGKSTMLSTTSQYALRALVHLAKLDSGEMVLGRTLSSECRIPGNYLSKLMLVLRNAGYVDAVRGANGGYKLDKAAREIHVVDVVDLFEGVKSEPKCLLGENHECTDELACSAHAKFRRMRLAYIDFLAGTTIASLSKNGPQKKQ